MGCTMVAVFNPRVSPLKWAPMGQLRALQAEVPAGGSCGAQGKKEGEAGGEGGGCPRHKSEGSLSLGKEPAPRPAC